jgi:hypothetical protein
LKRARLIPDGPYPIKAWDKLSLFVQAQNGKVEFTSAS